MELGPMASENVPFLARLLNHIWLDPATQIMLLKGEVTAS